MHIQTYNQCHVERGRRNRRLIEKKTLVLGKICEKITIRPSIEEG